MIEFFQKHVVVIVLVLAGAVLLFFFGEWLYDTVGEIVYDKQTERRMQADAEMQKKVDALMLENAKLKAQNEERARLLEQADKARTEADVQEIADANQKLKDKFRKIENTPADKQLEEYCKETTIAWDFCQGVGK